MDATLESLYAYVGEVGFQNSLLRKENANLQAQVKSLTEPKTNVVPPKPTSPVPPQDSNAGKPAEDASPTA